MAENDNARLDAIAKRRAAITDFEHIHYPERSFHQNSLAEVGADGKWKSWDMQTDFSTEACEFIASAPSDIDYLLAEIAALTAERDALVADYQSAYDRPVKLRLIYRDDNRDAEPDPTEADPVTALYAALAESESAE